MRVCAFYDCVDGKLIHSSILEFPGEDVIVKHKVDFAKSTVFRLGQAEPAPDIAEQIGAGVEKTGFGAPVPSYNVQVSFGLDACCNSITKSDLPVGESMRGVTELLKMPVRL